MRFEKASRRNIHRDRNHLHPGFLALHHHPLHSVWQLHHDNNNNNDDDDDEDGEDEDDEESGEEWHDWAVGESVTLVPPYTRSPSSYSSQMEDHHHQPHDGDDDDVHHDDNDEENCFTWLYPVIASKTIFKKSAMIMKLGMIELEAIL